MGRLGRLAIATRTRGFTSLHGRLAPRQVRVGNWHRWVPRPRSGLASGCSCRPRPSSSRLARSRASAPWSRRGWTQDGTPFPRTCRVGPDSERLVRNGLKTRYAVQSRANHSREVAFQVGFRLALTSPVDASSNCLHLCRCIPNQRQGRAHDKKHGPDDLAGVQSPAGALIQGGGHFYQRGVCLRRQNELALDVLSGADRCRVVRRHWQLASNRCLNRRERGGCDCGTEQSGDATPHFVVRDSPCHTYVAHPSMTSVSESSGACGVRQRAVLSGATLPARNASRFSTRCSTSAASRRYCWATGRRIVAPS